MKITKTILKHLIKEEYNQAKFEKVVSEAEYEMEVSDYAIYREFYSDNVDRLKMKYINNEYKSVIMYSRRIKEPRIQKDPKRLKLEKHYYTKSVKKLEEFVMMVVDKLRKEDAKLLLEIIKKAKNELGI